MKSIKDFIGRKKGKALIAGILLVVAKEVFELPAESAEHIVNLIMVYIIGQGIADTGKEMK